MEKPGVLNILFGKLFRCLNRDGQDIPDIQDIPDNLVPILCVTAIKLREKALQSPVRDDRQ
ncbi:MAG: hypothetical protein GY749_31675 [Desulfobacteraceae bacterium]|nr:hypothetical protein [Desulfobacteraceae bacterium]